MRRLDYKNALNVNPVNLKGITPAKLHLKISRGTAVALERELEGDPLGYCMCPIVDAQLVQDFLNVVFNGQRTDAKQVSNFIVTLAHLDETQDLRFPVGYKPSGLSRRLRMLMNPLIEQHAHQCRMHVRYQQIEEICLSAGQCIRNLGKHEQALCPATCVRHSVGRKAFQIAAFKVARKLLVPKVGRITGAQQNRLISIGIPRRHDAKYQTPIGPAKLG